MRMTGVHRTGTKFNMSKSKNNISRSEKNKREEMIDAILGPDEEMTDETAAEILNQYGIDETKLLDNFKVSVQKHLRQIPASSDESKKLGAMLRDIGEFQRASAPEAISPKDWIAGLMNNLIPRQSAPSYSYRDRKEGDLPASDQELLDGLKKELEEDNGNSE